MNSLKQRGSWIIVFWLVFISVMTTTRTKQASHLSFCKVKQFYVRMRSPSMGSVYFGKPIMHCTVFMLLYPQGVYFGKPIMHCTVFMLLYPQELELFPSVETSDKPESVATNVLKLFGKDEVVHLLTLRLSFMMLLLTLISRC